MTDNRIKITTKQIFDNNIHYKKITQDDENYRIFDNYGECLMFLAVSLFEITDFPADKDEVLRPVEIKVGMWGKFYNKNGSEKICKLFSMDDGDYYKYRSGNGNCFENFTPLTAEDFIKMAKDNGIELVEKE